MDPLEGITPQRREGAIRFVQEQIQVRDPEGDGPPGLLLIPDRCTVKVDGAPVTQTAAITSASVVEIQCKDIPPTVSVELTPASDLLSLTMTVNLTEGKHFRIADSNFDNPAAIELVEEPIPPVPPSADRLQEICKQAGYVGRFDDEAIAMLALATQTESRVVLHGKPPVPGQCARYQNLSLEFHNDELQRWRPVNAVKAGTICAVLVPAVPGVDGVDISGNRIEAPMPPDPLPHLGEGLELMDGRMVAMRDGRFVHSKSLYDVLPSLELNEDIEAKGGFIEFDGDVLIRGSILDGSVMRATGMITVHGGIYGSTVVGLGGVRTGSSIANSRIVGGQATAGFEDWYRAIQSLLSAVAALREEIHEAVAVQVKAHQQQAAGSRSMQSVNAVQQARQRLETCFSDLKGTMQEVSMLEGPGEKEDDRWSAILRTIRSKWQNSGLADIKMEDVQSLESALKAYSEHLDGWLNHPPANVEVESVVSSVLLTTGDISVGGRGVISSALECGGQIEIRGFMRGGSAIAKTQIDVKELGSPLGVETNIRVHEPNGQVNILLRHPNTLIEIGGMRNRNEKTERHVTQQGLSRP